MTHMQTTYKFFVCFLFAAGFGTFDVSAQAIWRNFFSTNQNPIVEVVAGSNATVQASTVGVNLRRFTVNSIPGGTASAQTNISWTAVTNLQSAQVPYTVITNAPWQYGDADLTNWATLNTNVLSTLGQTNISWTAITNVSQIQIPLASVTNANNLTNWALLSTNAFNLPRSIGISVDGGGSAITLGTKGYITIPYMGTILSCTLMASPSGSIEFQVWRTNSSDASFPPTIVGAIGTNSLTSDNYNVDTTLTGWTTLLSSNDVIAFNISSNAATITNCTLQLKIQP